LSTSRANIVSSFTIIKGSMIEETYAVFRDWNFDQSREDNLRRVRDENTIGAMSTNWLRDTYKVLHRRFDPAGRDRPLVELAQAGCDRQVWKPLLLWHMTRDEFLLRDFLTGWLYEHYVDGAYRLRTADVVPYLRRLDKRPGVQVSGKWSDATTSRVASGLLRMASDFGLMTGTLTREFGSYHLPEESFLYLLHAMAETESNARKIVDSPDWHMYLMDAADVERELLRLHQYRRLHYEVAGSLARLDLPYASLTDYARGLMS
jgi:hypothetical protein